MVCVLQKKSQKQIANKFPINVQDQQVVLGAKGEIVARKISGLFFLSGKKTYTFLWPRTRRTSYAHATFEVHAHYASAHTEVRLRAHGFSRAEH